MPAHKLLTNHLDTEPEYNKYQEIGEDRLEKSSNVFSLCLLSALPKKFEIKRNLKENVTWHAVYLCLLADGSVLHGERDEMPHAWLEWKDSEQWHSWDASRQALTLTVLLSSAVG